MSDQSSHDPQHKLPTLFQQMQHSHWFTRLLARIKALQVLQAAFDQECPLELTGRCRVLGIQQACLIIEVNDASRATQLHYRTRELLPALRRHSEFAELKKISARIARAGSPSGDLLPGSKAGDSSRFTQ